MVPPDRRCRLDVSYVDVAATLLAAAGIDVDSLGLEGENLLPYLTEARPEPACRDCFSQYNVAPDFRPWHGVESWRALVRKPWKYVLHQNGETELYNHSDDPYEIKNQAQDPAMKEVAASLQDALLSWSRRTGDTFPNQLNLRT